MNLPKKFLVVLLLSVMWPVQSFAHQPRLTVGPAITVTDPEISKAYYGELTGEQHVYTIRSESPFSLYVNVLEPDIEGQSKNTSVFIIKSASPDSRPYGALDGMNFEWTKFWEPYGADSYWKGPEFRTQAEAGTYEIRVLNTMNRGKYVLAIGETEAFDGKEIWNALKLVPQLKRDFFKESPINFILSPFGWGYVLATYLVALISGLLAHTLVNKLKHKTGFKLPAEHRLLLAGLGVVFLLWAVATTWNPLIIFLSGVCLFEASGISAILSRAK